MKSIGEILLLIILILTGIWFYRKYQENQKRKKELEKALQDFFRAKMDSIKGANNEFLKHLDIANGYFTNFNLSTWKKLYTSLYDAIDSKSFDNIRLSNLEVDSIITFKKYYINSAKYRDEFNKHFTAEELKNYSSFFDNIEGRKLDIQQRTSIVTDEDNNIVIAGAGSGKTTTIVGKVNYVIDRYKVAPEEILLISFTNKSATTLAERVNINGIEAKTFHKFGKDIIVKTEGKQPSIFNELQFKPLLVKYFKELTKDPTYLQKVTNYFTDFLKFPKSEFEFKNRGDYVQYLRDQNFKSYKLKPIKALDGKVTYKMEVVKSIEECKIANFLLFNNISYIYENPYEHQTANESFRQYKPDFTINQNGKKVYIEHFGISRNGDVPDWFTGSNTQSAREKYHADMNWKRDLHTHHETILIESYSYEMYEGTLYKNLEKKLADKGIFLKPKSPQEIWNIINEAAREEIESFTTLVGTFITLMKSNNYSINDILNKNKKIDNAFIQARNYLFIEILKPIYDHYQDYLLERNEIDFSDMINKASSYITNGRYKQKYSYIIIDEFQDISIGRYQLINAIKRTNPSSKLFCVGDDWQSIYRFSGSDIALFKKFENYFGFTVKSKIETTYRFHNPLISLSSTFIQKNPNQAKKDLIGITANRNTKYDIHYSNSENQDDTQSVKAIFDKLLLSINDIEDKEIIILGRYGFDMDRIKNENLLFNIDKNTDTITYNAKLPNGVVKRLKAQFMTVHKSKGLEGDIVIILNCNSGKYGFPSEMSDDLVLNLLLSDADQFENGEERRLFYVAMTRAKEKVIFVTDSSYKSKFIQELEVENGISPNKKCPQCKTSDMVLRKSGIAKNGNKYKFFGCANFQYGCDFTTTEWINQ
ncbi:helicase IV [Elizabethkingia anophelis]|uniref:UvrD-helicase domain-containing protein n=1 Tax=Elizabethkingia anophelis TaxID=1117645 RepID=UPI0021A29464|nr:UvrD-helicase domain-containing protein [Elizabethkingia anophelis]MCT3828439.1 UvrD-helicase domain-containing protein [Elizabethkingia anophelis]MCT3839354.1 UvrD-helicase domain-containing protein [Elizabethkingia anophelis]MCT3842987.1 UvrD-helicase domain-containing protein [Elizabethkingia anophelis]MCT3850151.1 UvrD-helicase domain-containing protein [Elizabethkingia anophelis]